MARSSRSLSGAGASAHARYRAEWQAGRTRRLVVRAALTVAAFVVVTFLLNWLAGLVVAVVVAVADTVQRWRRHEAVRSWRQGAKGERKTARRLRRLERAGHLVLHDRALPRGRANVDHLVIGACGVFVVDTKNWNANRRITKGGRGVKIGRQWGPDAVRSVIYEAKAVSEALSRAVGGPVEVTPLLAVHGPHVPLRGINIDGVRMLRASMVPGWITRRGPRLAPATETRLREIAPTLFRSYEQQTPPEHGKSEPPSP
ncbi:hypothetical protein Sme01_23310 [Sphaerisporangium melleum]|uniref:NERD domain-containing protein n=1 Tax=Sphaerisporangium melleum TaxID=321316 RepID=A0A917VV04_9ACTN|nr:nuclease-related domain-containing protein [Sphaerisporangium melleum]GGL20966.1 hypothetical protein GCM10007964_73660 [Sphaerisporangium melleum]GII69855.1 hypothetical protein Sme01_23310 [Sphaerisporangium melleum]